MKRTEYILLFLLFPWYFHSISFMVLGGKSVIWIGVSLEAQWYLFWLLSGFTFVFSFQKFNYHVSCLGFLWVYIASWIWRLSFAYPFGRPSPIIFFKYSFVPTLFFLSWDPTDSSIISFDTVYRSILFFHSIFSVLFIFSKFCWSVLKFSDSVFCHLHFYCCSVVFSVL